MADRARLDVRRDDGDLAEPRQRARERMDALGVHAVVVGHQDLFHVAKDKYSSGARNSGSGLGISRAETVTGDGYGLGTGDW